MAKKAATKAQPKKVAAKPTPKKPTAKPLAKAQSAAKTTKTPIAKPAPKPAPKPALKPALKPAPKPAPAPALHKPARPVNESPPVDHGLALLPLFLGATHGYLSRTVDDSWSDALAKYRKALQSAIDYEAKRSPESRGAMASFVHQKLNTLLNQLQARLTGLQREAALPGVADSQALALRQQARRLTQEMRAAVDLLQDALSAQKLLKGLTAPPLLTTSLLSWVARVADYERSAS